MPWIRSKELIRLEIIEEMASDLVRTIVATRSDAEGYRDDIRMKMNLLILACIGLADLPEMPDTLPPDLLR